MSARFASFTASKPSGTIPLSVVFSDTSGGTFGAPSTWSWDFGDGSSLGTTQNPTHIYTTAGIYQVVLTATWATGSVTLVSAITLINTTATPGISYTLTAAMNGTRQRLNASTGSPTQVVVGKTTETWSAGAWVEILCVNSTDGMTFVPDTGVVLTTFDGANIQNGEYARASRNPDGSWDLHIKQIKYTNANSNTATTALLQAGNNVTLTTAGGRLVIAAAGGAPALPASTLTL